jgi:hypothetical protein
MYIFLTLWRSKLRSPHNIPHRHTALVVYKFLNSALDGSDCSTPRPGRFSPGKEEKPILQKMFGGPPVPVSTDVKLRTCLVPTDFRHPDRPVRIMSRYGLAFPGHFQIIALYSTVGKYCRVYYIAYSADPEKFPKLFHFNSPYKAET